MKSQTKSQLLGAALLSGAVLVGWLNYPAPRPTSAVIEATAMTAGHDAGAARRLSAWARDGLPVAQREQGLRLQRDPAQRAQALTLLEHAARAGDVEAAFHVGELYRTPVAGKPGAPAQAWPWYKQAAEGRHAKAALMLGLLARNGEGVPRDDGEAARWLTLSSELGNAHAMFLLANVYNGGLGVPRDAVRARALLEEAAEHDYPPALQELAMTMQTGDALTEQDTQRASHLMKEATEHRRNNWNRF